MHVEPALLLRLGDELGELDRAAEHRRGRESPCARAASAAAGVVKDREADPRGESTPEYGAPIHPLLVEAAQELVLLLLKVLHPIPPFVGRGDRTRPVDGDAIRSPQSMCPWALRAWSRAFRA